MRCDEALALIPSYLDGELTESQAAPLRRHLLDCQACRAGAQGEKNMKRWFQPDARAAIPQGFAARIARRAFAGDTGEPQIEITPVASPATHVAPFDLSAPFDAARGESARSDSAHRAGPRAQEDPILRFVLQATAAAALVVLALSLALRSQTLPSGTSLRAADERGEISVDQALERLDELNHREGGTATPVRAGGRAAPGAATKSEETRGPKIEETRGK